MNGMKQNRCVIVSGGDYCPADDLRPGEDYVIACDRGYTYCSRLGLKPDLLISDFDSYTGPVDESVPVNAYASEKDDTDTMLAVRCAIERGCDEILLCCALGGRLDHLIANLQALIFARKHGRSQDKHHHELSGCMRAADQHMAKKPLPGILIVAGNAECFGKFHHGIRNLPRFAVFDQTAPHRYDPVRSLRIDAGKMLPGSSAPLIGTGAVHLVPVIIRILHADDPVRFHIRSEKLSDPFFLFRQSIRIGLPYGDAASAVFFVWTIHVLYPAHDPSPYFIFRVPETVMESPEPSVCLPAIPLLA